MSTINNTDLFLVSRAGTNYQVTAADVASYSTTSGLPAQAGQGGLFLTTNGTTLSWAAAGGGGSVTGTLPIVVTGSAISINAATNATAGSMSAADKAKLDGAATIVSAVTGTLPITVATGTSTPVIAINAATTALPGSIQLATAAENAAGTDATKAVTPAFSVPKDASGMTGAAIIPSGTTAQRPATPAAGMQRYNSTGAFWEGRIGSNWAPFDQRFPVVTAVSATVNPEDYVVVTAATQTITLPATPLPGACVTVVVAGTWLDTVVARNGSNIMGLAQDLTLNIAYSALQFTYTDATNGWRVN